MSTPVICFGQQPCGFFPKRFLVAKINTARQLRNEIGGEIVFFYHDSDHDPRETRTNLRRRTTDEAAQLNFTFENKIQRKFSPLYLKRVQAGWQEKTIGQLPNYVEHPLINIFKQASAANVADFCLEMYRGMGLLEGIKVMRSSDPAFRLQARDITDFFVDLPYENEIVRARFADGKFKLHEGGSEFIELPLTDYKKEQVSPTRDTRLGWMQSVINCTHYISGAGEQQYLNKADAPEITYIEREAIERSDDAYTEL
ncbi:MAG: hypothetical protein JSS86_06265 [Cyanobacteria bacterium SZAS LIN-2]|nr:hypothetical protein [Cyanobacteria bacterium SZAS LIN-2]MBS2007239.1 hypothetical protein [Cyanobacteria bacterium SZAS TMP-1]